ncbi:MAG: hypothetical protein IKD17_05850, partial [Alistipes sp.]|nr:hypothetical protein [Alistipes sp.]
QAAVELFVLRIIGCPMGFDLDISVVILVVQREEKFINMLNVYNRIHPASHKDTNHPNNIQMRVK